MQMLSSLEEAFLWKNLVYSTNFPCSMHFLPRRYKIELGEGYMECPCSYVGKALLVVALNASAW